MDKQIYERLITEPCLGLLLVDDLKPHQLELMRLMFEVRAVEIEGRQRLMIPCVYWSHDPEGEGKVIDQSAIEIKIEEIKIE